MTGKMLNKDIIAPVYITVLAVVAVVYGFTIVPSPITAHNRALDHKRVSDLGNLKASIDSYFNDNGNLPSSLSMLKSDDASTPLDKTDPQTKQPYDYKVTSTETYKLCATFLTDSSKEDPNIYDDNNPDYSTYKDDFKHPAGYYCFNENETGDSTSYGSPEPTDYSVGDTTPAANPSVSLSSFDNKGNCAWTPTFHLTGFSPYSQITASADVALDNACSQKPNQHMTETVQLTQQTNADGNITAAYPNELSYGDYNFTFTDSDGNGTSLHFVYEPPATAPTIVQGTPTPAPGGGGGGPRDINSGSDL